MNILFYNKKIDILFICNIFFNIINTLFKTKLLIIMCGIWTLISKIPIVNHGKYYDAFMKIKNRGPEFSSFNFIQQNLLIGFHRLAIIDTTPEGNQPFHYVRDDGSYVYCICNGEIYDHELIKKEYNIITKSKSDCEVIIPLYEKLGVEKMIKLLGSEFAFIIFDISKEGKVKIIAGRDPIGVRPIFYGIDDNSLCISSEMKGLSDIYEKVYVFPPGHYMIYEDGEMNFTQYYFYEYKQLDPVPPIEEIYAEIRTRFTNAVRRRLMTDRPIGFLLSGGLDSNLCVAVAKQLMPNKKFPVFTLAINENSPDLYYSKKVVKYLNLEHYIIKIDYDQLLKEIDETIYAIESYDITTIRASAINRMIGKYIAENTEIKVLVGGDNSDEVHCSYLFVHNAPSFEDVKNEAINLVKNVHKFDGKRCDRSLAYHGLEVRLPFADHEYVDYFLSLPANLIAPIDGIEKFTLRKAFFDTDILPKDCIMRVKEAMSDGISGTEKSWYELIQEHMELIITDDEFNKNKNNFKHCTPYTKESYYYRKKFVQYFGNTEEKALIIPKFWLGKWNKSTDPSARTLNIYKKNT